MGGNATNALCLATCASQTTRAALLCWGTLASRAAIGAFRREEGRIGVFGRCTTLCVRAAPTRGGLCYLTRVVTERFFVKRR